MPLVSIDPEMGAIFCCDGAGLGGLCDPWCDNAPAEWQEAWATSQHLGHVDLSGMPYVCDSEECCADFRDDDSDDGCGVAHG